MPPLRKSDLGKLTFSSRRGTSRQVNQPVGDGRNEKAEGNQEASSILSRREGPLKVKVFLPRAAAEPGGAGGARKGGSETKRKAGLRGPL